MVQSKNQKYFSLIIVLAVLAAIFIRVIVAPINRSGDIAVHQEWARTLYQTGLQNSYFYPVWTYSPPTQPPLMMSLFYLSRHIYENRFYLSELHNLIRIPPAALILWFDSHGEFVTLKLWAIIGDLLSGLIAGLFVYQLTHKRFPAFLAGILILFNPLSIYESAHWGQNDILGTAFIYLSLLAFNSALYPTLTISLLFIGVSLKPTVLLVFPLFLFFYLKKINFKNTVVHFLGLVLGLLLLAYTFTPYVSTQNSFLPQVANVINHRIAPSSKGVVRASNSAHNFYALFFTLDTTSGSQKFLFFDLITLGNIFLILLLSLSAYIIYRQPLKLDTMLLVIYIFTQGCFLFTTGMLERYFFPAFIASIVLMVTNFRRLGKYFLLQNLLWLLNLLYPRPENQLVIKFLSLFSIINYLAVVYYCLRFLPSPELHLSSGQPSLTHKAAIRRGD